MQGNQSTHLVFKLSPVSLPKLAAASNHWPEALDTMYKSCLLRKLLFSDFLQLRYSCGQTHSEHNLKPLLLMTIHIASKKKWKTCFLFNNILLQIWQLLRQQILKSSPHKKKMFSNYVWRWKLTKLIVVFISQYI